MLWEIFTLNIVLHCALIWLVKCVRVDTTPRTWTEASKACTLFGSTYVSTFSPISVDTSSIPDDSTSLYWIGAVNTYTLWFTILGCFEVPSSDPNFVDQGAILDMTNPASDCLNRCAGTSDDFALSLTNCYCLTSQNIAIGLQACSKKSFANAPFDFYGVDVDGNPNTVPTVHYRKRTQGSPNEGNGVGNCAAAYGNKPYSHEYLDCNTELGYLCNEKSGINIVTKYYSTSKTWPNAVLNCSLILSANYGGIYNDVPSGETRTWTGISRRNKQIWSSAIPTDGTTYSCLAINKAGQVTPQDCSSTSLASLCKGDLQTSTSRVPTTRLIGYTTTSSLITMSEKNSKLKSTISAGKKTTVGLPEDGNVSDTFPGPPYNTGVSGGKDNIIITLAMVIAFLLVLCVILILMVLHFRKQRNESREQQLYERPIRNACNTPQESAYTTLEQPEYTTMF